MGYRGPRKLSGQNEPRLRACSTPKHQYNHKVNITVVSQLYIKRNVDWQVDAEAYAELANPPTWPTATDVNIATSPTLLLFQCIHHLY